MNKPVKIPLRQIKLRPTQTLTLTCRECPLDKAQLHHPKMPATGAKVPLFYFLGESPSSSDDEDGEQFAGESGQVVRSRIPSQWENHIRWNNVINCKSGSDEPSAQEQACCRVRVVTDIEKTKPEILVGFGEVPLNWVLGAEKKGDTRKIIPWRGRRMPVKIGSHTCWFYVIGDPETLLYRKSRMYEANLRAFENDLRRVFTDYASGLPPPEVVLPEDYYTGIRCIEDYTRTGFNDVLRFLQAAAKLDSSTIDIETSELRPYNRTSKFLSVAIGTYEETVAFPLEHIQAKWSASQLKQIYAALEKYLLSPGRKCAHFAKFEMEWFVWIFGPKIAHKVNWDDTAAMAHVLDERKGKALEALTEIHFGFNVKKLSGLDTKKLDTYPVADVLKYNALDTKWTDALRLVLWSIIEDQGLSTAYENVNRVTPSFALMQAKGVHRNVPVINQFSEELVKRKDNVVLSILQNQDVRKFTTANGKFKPTSNPDIQKFFRDFLKVPHPNREQRNFKYSLTEDILEKFSHPVAGMLLDMRTTSGNLAKYVAKLLDEPSERFPEGGAYVCDDGLAHANFTQLITATGRPACEDPPLQQWPKREHREIRRVICAPPEHHMVAVDFGQLEARIIATLSRDPTLCGEISNKYDIHGDWTDQLGMAFDKSLLKTKESRKHLRDYIKNKWTFPLFYGSILDSVAYDLGSVFKKEIPPSQLEPHYQKFWDKYRVVLDWQEKLESFYWKRGYVETAFGFRRHEPLSKNELINTPVQGTAGQLVMEVQTRLSKIAYFEQKPQYQPVINMHDDLTFYFPEKSVEEDIERVAKEMCTFDLNFLIVPLSVEVSVGPNWADQQEVGVFYSTDFGWKPPISTKPRRVALPV